MTDDKAYELAYNAHERAEAAALDAMRASLATEPSEALMVLCDPQWNWETRSWMSAGIIDHADDVLTVRLNAQVAA